MSKKTNSSTEERVTAESVQDATVTVEGTVSAELPETMNSTESEVLEEKTVSILETNASESGGEKEKAEQSTVKTEKRYGLVRFLQISPQPSYVESLLRSMYAGDVMTEAEWLAKIKSILNRKVR